MEIILVILMLILMDSTQETTMQIIMETILVITMEISINAILVITTPTITARTLVMLMVMLME